MKRTALLITSITTFVTSLLLPALVWAAPPPAGLNLFNPAAIRAGTDLSLDYLQDIFGVVGGVLHGTGTQILGYMFGYFNAAVLALGGIIIIYTLLVSTLNTANEGEVLGKKWSSLWIPIRSAAGIGLLIPKATGYCAIQIFMMWVIVQGVGAADTLWGVAIMYIEGGGVIIQQAVGVGSDPVHQAGNILKAETCMYALQSILQEGAQAARKQGVKVRAVPNLLTTVVPIEEGPNRSPTTSCIIPTRGSAPIKNCVAFPGQRLAKTHPELAPLVGICGYFTLPTGGRFGAGIQKELAVSHRIAMQSMILNLSDPAQQVVNAQLSLPSSSGFATTKQPVEDVLSKRILVESAANYVGIMRPVEQKIKQEESSTASASGGRAVLASFEKYGWMMAGALYQNLAGVNNDLQAHALKTPAVHIYDTNVLQKLSPYVPAYVDPYTSAIVGLLGSNAPGTLNHFVNDVAKKSAAHFGGRTKHAPAPQAGQVAGYLTGTVLKFLPIIGPLVSIVTEFALLATAQSNNINPIILLAVMGYGMLSLVVQLWVIGAGSAAAVTAGLGAIPCVTEGNAVNTVLIWIVPFLWFMMSLLFVNGAVLAFYLPMIPFIIFTFGAIGWMIAVVEAMVAAPLIALGITHPEGHEVLGRADPAVLLLVNVFLRPSMMIIGLIVAIMMSYVGVWFLNKGFFLAFWDSFLHNTPITAIFFAIPAMFIIYTLIVISIMNQAFALINVIPDRVLRWIGGQAEGISDQARAALGEAKSGFEGGMKGMGESAGESAKAGGRRKDQMKAEGEPEKEGAEGKQAKLQAGPDAKKGGKVGGTEAQ